MSDGTGTHNKNYPKATINMSYKEMIIAVVGQFRKYTHNTMIGVITSLAFLTETLN